jgi:hypothetical protein
MTLDRPPRLLPLALLGLGLFAPAPASTRPIVVLMTDFGQLADSVAICKGVMLSVEPELTIVDLTQDVPHFDIRAGAHLLEDVVKYYPAGTAFVAVVDPGVGTERRALAVRTKSGHFLVGPDNGLLSFAIEIYGADEVRVASNTEWFNQLDPLSHTFHGRDIFSPVGARLAAGQPFDRVGPVTDRWVRLEQPRPARADGVLRGEVTFIDTTFGNAASNIPGEWIAVLGLEPSNFAKVRIGDQTLILRYVLTFGQVEKGELMLYVNSRGVLDLAIREGDFATIFGVHAGDPLEIRKFQP